MRGKIVWGMVMILLFLGVRAQEQESAELFLDEYTDEFQNLFFEALKQKGIQNYDRAVEKLLECKNLQPENMVIDYELARAYYLDKKYTVAQEYAITTLEKEPENYWYLENLISILDKQGNAIEAFSDRIAMDNIDLKKNLATIYFQNRKYNQALAILETIPNSNFSNALKQKIETFHKNLTTTSTGVIDIGKVNEEKTQNPVEAYKTQVKDLILSKNFAELKRVSKEAMDIYPLQPYFQYGYGLALSKTGSPKEAVEILETALDFIFDDTPLRSQIYKALSETFASMGNSKKANEYINKIETGS